MKKEITIVDNALFAEFKKDCKVLSLAKEYPGYVGYEKYMILTDLTKDELNQKYSVLLNNYEPYIIGSSQLYSPIADYEKNEDKFEKRNARNTISICVDEDADNTFEPLQVGDYLTELSEQQDADEKRRLIHTALGTLTDSQRRRLLMWAIDGMTEEEIAMREGSSQQAISKNLDKARKKFELIFSKGLYFGTPLSKEDEGIIDDGE